MYKSCRYCGRIHKKNIKCSKKPPNKKKATEASEFRNSFKWQEKREQIKKRDLYLCQVCKRELYNTTRKYNYEDLEVHHAVPIEIDPTLALNSDNLITLCRYHHKLCDKGKIQIDEIKIIINEQEN